MKGLICPTQVGQATHWLLVQTWPDGQLLFVVHPAVEV